MPMQPPACWMKRQVPGSRYRMLLHVSHQLSQGWKDAQTWGKQGAWQVWFSLSISSPACFVWGPGVALLRWYKMKPHQCCCVLSKSTWGITLQLSRSLSSLRAPSILLSV